MSLTVLQVITQSQLDTRQIFNVVNDQVLLTQWLDRIHKDCLHSGVYSTLNAFSFQITTTAGNPSYGTSAVTPTIRRITGAYDRTKDRILFPLERATSPVSQVDKQEPQPGQTGGYQTKFQVPPISAMSLQSKQPEYFRFFASSQTVNLYPTPAQQATIAFSYEGQVTTLVNPTDVLVVPEDGVDMLVAGMNYLASINAKRAEEAQIWAQIYEKLKMGSSLI